MLLPKNNMHTLNYPHTVQPFPPSITGQPADAIAREGTATNFSCSSDGEPVPTIIWSFGGTRLVPSSLVDITSVGGNSVLTLANVGSSSVGLYQCTASNSMGTATSNTAQLQIASEWI